MVVIHLAKPSFPLSFTSSYITLIVLAKIKFLPHRVDEIDSDLMLFQFKISKMIHFWTLSFCAMITFGAYFIRRVLIYPKWQAIDQ